MDINKSGAFIKQKRNEKNLTQKELAEILNCTDKAVSRWETGKGFPEVSFLIPLSDALGVSVNEIILGESIENENLIEKSNETLVDVMETSIKKENNGHKLVFALIVFIEAFVFYIPTLTAGDGDNMGIVFLNIIAVLACSMILGLVNIALKYKLLFVPITAALFIPSAVIYAGFANFTDYALLYSAFFAVSSFVLILLGTGVTKAASLILKRQMG